MYKSFEEAKAAALDAINRIYDGEKMGCVVTENKKSAKSRKTWWGFRFNDSDSNGEFVVLEDGTLTRKYLI